MRRPIRDLTPAHSLPLLQFDPQGEKPQQVLERYDPYQTIALEDHEAGDPGLLHRGEAIRPTMERIHLEP